MAAAVVVFLMSHTLGATHPDALRLPTPNITALRMSAAVLVVLQADAAVLHATLCRRPSGAAANKTWLLPSARDVVELSLSNSLSYKCAPGMWLALAGCGHAVVSASLIAAAAQLVPLLSAAAAAASRLQVMSGPAQQQLEASLQLSSLDSVDLLSSTHAVLALESAGWLHQQFTTAAGAALIACGNYVVLNDQSADRYLLGSIMLVKLALG